MTINIESNEQWKDAFLKACEKGHLEDVRRLCQKKYLDLGWADVHASHEEGFRKACFYGYLDVVKYLLTSPELKEAGHKWVNLHVNEEEGLYWACRKGHMEIIKFLLTSKELKETGRSFANLHADNERSLMVACQRKQWDVVKYLLTSHELIDAGHTFANVHVQDEKVFREACDFDDGMVRWLVMDYGIKKTKTIKKIIQDYPQAQEYFRARQERDELEMSLNAPLEEIKALKPFKL